jgi:hypothetical protein
MKLRIALLFVALVVPAMADEPLAGRAELDKDGRSTPSNNTPRR